MIQIKLINSYRIYWEEKKLTINVNSTYRLTLSVKYFFTA